MWYGARAAAVGWEAPGVIYAAGNGGLYRTDDCGATWRPMGSPEAIGPSRPFLIDVMAVDRDGGLYTGWQESEPLSVSRDGGASWERGLTIDQAFGPPVVRVYPTSVSPSPAAPGLVYGAFRANGTSLGGLKRSRDGGLTWERRPGPGFSFHVAADAVDPDTVYVAGAACRQSAAPCTPILSRSTDGGATFAQIGEFERPILALAVAADASQLWVATEARGMFVSRDRGATWERVFLPDGPDPPHVDNLRSLSASPFDPAVVYAVTETAQLWAYRDDRPDSGTLAPVFPEAASAVAPPEAAAPGPSEPPAAPEPPSAAVSTVLPADLRLPATGQAGGDAAAGEGATPPASEDGAR
jgi:photosystem II stability/assembly factor-like uncharacterized protein